MIINKKDVAAYTSIFTIAEIASAHEGRVDLALRLADGVSTTGADAIKYQMLKADNLLVPTHHKYDSFKELEFSDGEWGKIFQHSESLGLFVIAEVFDELSFDLAEALKAAMYKVSTADLTNVLFLRRVVSTMKPVILSVGAATEEEIRSVVETCEEIGNKKLILMHGFQNFPTEINDTNFRLLVYLVRSFGYDVGFADHIDAESELALIFPLMAVGYGASFIEKHITLDRAPKGRDYYSALNPSEFSKMVSMIRKVEKAYGGSEFGFSPAERKYRQLMKKRIADGRDIAQGEEITAGDIVFRRCDEEGLLPNEYEGAIGRALRSIRKHAAIRGEDVR